MLNVFVDPKTTARRVPAPLSWLWPAMALSVIYVVVGYLIVPCALTLADVRMAQAGMPPEQMERARNIAHLVTQITIPATPLFVTGFLALFAWLAGLAGSLPGMRANFRDVFSLMAACALIPAPQYIASYIVIRAKGDELTSQEQMTPPFGLDLLFQNAHGTLLALLNFFSIFEIWYLIVLTVGLACLTKVSVGKAFFAITPAWVIPLLLRLVQALFQGNAGG
jgi:hypothetical protein